MTGLDRTDRMPWPLADILINLAYQSNGVDLTPTQTATLDSIILSTAGAEQSMDPETEWRC